MVEPYRIEKQCSKCKTIKPIDDFYRQKSHKDGRQAHCKKCDDDRRGLWFNNNREKSNTSRKKWAKENPEKRKKSCKKWRTLHLEKSRQVTRENLRKRRANNPRYKLGRNISTMIWWSIRSAKNNQKWETLVGYTVEDLKKHIGKLFKEGMTWNNYGRNGWHIDHKIPVSVHNFKNSEDIDFKKCWALSNLQPLWAIDNHKKRDKLDRSFQPSLALGIGGTNARTI